MFQVCCLSDDSATVAPGECRTAEVKKEVKGAAKSQAAELAEPQADDREDAEAGGVAEESPGEAAGLQPVEATAENKKRKGDDDSVAVGAPPSQGARQQTQAPVARQQELER